MINILDRFLYLEEKRVDYSGWKGWGWRIFGYIGNNFYRKKPPEIYNENGLKLLNLGAGNTGLRGFVNADYYRLHKLFSKTKPDWMIDLNKPLKCDDNYWDGVLLEHVNEHLLYSSNYLLFEEIYRILKPGAIVRIIVPDLKRYLNWDSMRTSEPKMNRYYSLPEAISNLTQNHAHVSVWDEELLHETLDYIGFVSIAKVNFGIGSRRDLVQDSENHKWQSLYMEAQKPIVSNSNNLDSK